MKPKPSVCVRNVGIGRMSTKIKPLTAPSVNIPLHQIIYLLAREKQAILRLRSRKRESYTMIVVCFAAAAEM